MLSLRMQDASSVEIALEQPTTVRLWVEDTDGSLQAVRRHIP